MFKAVQFIKSNLKLALVVTRSKDEGIESTTIYENRSIKESLCSQDISQAPCNASLGLFHTQFKKKDQITF